MCGVCHVHSCCNIHKKCIIIESLFYIELCFLYVSFFSSHGPKARNLRLLWNSLSHIWLSQVVPKGLHALWFKPHFKKLEPKIRSDSGQMVHQHPPWRLVRKFILLKGSWFAPKSRLGFLNDAYLAILLCGVLRPYLNFPIFLVLFIPAITENSFFFKFSARCSFEIAAWALVGGFFLQLPL